MNRLEQIRAWARKGPSDEVPSWIVDLLIAVADAAVEVDSDVWDANKPERIKLAAALAPLLEET